MSPSRHRKLRDIETGPEPKSAEARSLLLFWGPKKGPSCRELPIWFSLFSLLDFAYHEHLSIPVDVHTHACYPKALNPKPPNHWKPLSRKFAGARGRVSQARCCAASFGKGPVLQAARDDSNPTKIRVHQAALPATLNPPKPLTLLSPRTEPENGLKHLHGSQPA